MIYLDYNATAPLRAEVKEAMFEVLGQPLNPSSIHKQGRNARGIVQEAKAKILAGVGAENLIFCGLGTEANNLALAQISQAEKIAISPIEHDSIFKAAKNSTELKVDENGLIDIADLEEKLAGGNIQLASIILANNETGVVQKMKPIAALCKKYDVLLHLDASQALGRIRLNMADLGADFMTICAHKTGGPVGAAALLFRSHIELKPFMLGGGQQQGKRAGTEDVAAICGLAKIAEMLPELLDEAAKIRELRDYMEAEILAVASNAIIHSASAPRLPNTSNIAMPNAEAATQLIHFDSNNICVSSGAACSSGKVETSRILLAMGVKDAEKSVRVSLGHATTKEEIEFFIKKWKELFERIN